MNDEQRTEDDFDDRDAEPNRFAGRRRELLALIREAFDGVELGSGVGLRETVVIDDYGSDAERLAARATDEQHDWSKVIDDPDLQRLEWIGGSAFMDAEGLRFHLPAYLSYAVIHSDDGEVQMPEGLFYTLEMPTQTEYNRERLAILSPEQRRCVWAVWNYLRHEILESDDPEEERLLAEFWLGEGASD